MQISGSLAGEYCGMILQSLLHFCLLAGQLRTARTGFFPLFSLAPPEMIPEVDDLMLRGFHQMMENTLADEDLVSSLDELIENTIEEEEEEEKEEGEDLMEDLDEEPRNNKAITNDFFSSKHLPLQPGQNLIRALPILDQLRNVTADPSGRISLD